MVGGGGGAAAERENKAAPLVMRVLIVYRGRLEHARADPALRKRNDSQHTAFDAYDLPRNWENQLVYLIRPLQAQSIEIDIAIHGVAHTESVRAFARTVGMFACFDNKANQWARVVDVMRSVDIRRYDSLILTRGDLQWKRRPCLRMDRFNATFKEDGDSISDVFYLVPSAYYDKVTRILESFAESTSKLVAQMTLWFHLETLEIPIHFLQKGRYTAGVGRADDRPNPLYTLCGRETMPPRRPKKSRSQSSSGT